MLFNSVLSSISHYNIIIIIIYKLLDLQNSLGHIRKVRKKISDTCEVDDAEGNYRDELTASIDDWKHEGFFSGAMVDRVARCSDE
jgi:hypothetical protein